MSAQTNKNNKFWGSTPMLKSSLFALFLLSMATLTMSASSLPVPTAEPGIAVATAIEVAERD